MSRHDVDDAVMSQALRQAQLRVDEEVNTQNIIADALMNAELPDFFTVEMEDEGPSHCVALTVLKGRGKMNQYGKPVFSGYYRHSDVRLCSVSAVALFMFFRYHVSKEPFPDLSCSQQWYDIPFFVPI